MGILKIPQIPQYGVLIENDYGKENSLFHEVYQGAAKNVYDIINKQNQQRNELFFNPCIAFVGERGTGKSSAMSSFANFLENSTEKTCEWIDNDLIKQKIAKTKFYTLSPIDTANMGAQETIIADVSAELFTEFEKESNNINVEQKRQFIKTIKEVNETAILKSNGEWNQQGDQLLRETEKVVHINNLFKKVVKEYLKIVKRNEDIENCFLVIQIDDLDMNISNSYSIMEEIRNILSVSNVIILLSVDLEQLKSVLKINFENLLTANNVCKIDEVQHGFEKIRISKDLAYKYIEKLIPINRRHYMPEITNEQLKNIKSKNFLGDNDKEWYLMHLVETEGDSPCVLDAVMHLIWRKTLLIPIKNEYGDYALLPHNLRSLCNFIVFLRSMKDVAYKTNTVGKENPEVLSYDDFCGNEIVNIEYRNTLKLNLRKFYKYLVSNIENCHKPDMITDDETMANILLNLIGSLENVDLSRINKKIVGDILFGLYKHKVEIYSDIISTDEKPSSIFLAVQQHEMISMGDVLYVFTEIKKRTQCEYIHYLIDVIKTIWSIKMTAELYIIGCCDMDRQVVLTNTKCITQKYRDTVGALIINPDNSEVFCSKKKKNHMDWSVYKNKDKQSIYDLVIPKENIKVKKKSDAISEIHSWRAPLDSGEACYMYINNENAFYNLSHPFSLFSNLLYPETYKTSSAKYDIVSGWQRKHIMVFPFHSMDFINRFIERYLAKIKIIIFSTTSDSVMSYVLDTTKKTIEEMSKEIKDYIPCTSEQSKNLTNEALKSYFSLYEPIQTLIELLNWKNELVFVNKDLITKLKETTQKVKGIENNKNFDTEATTLIIDVLKELENTLSSYLVHKVNSQQTVTEKIVALNELSDLLSGKKLNKDKAKYFNEPIVPFFCG